MLHETLGTKYMNNSTEFIKELNDCFKDIVFAYPEFFNKYTESDYYSLLDTWIKYMKNFNIDLIRNSIDFYILNDKTGYPPKIGRLVDVMFNLKYEVIDFEEIWLIFKKCNSLSASSKKCWEYMPTLLQEIVSPENIEYFAFLESEYSREKFKDSLKTRYKCKIQEFKNQFCFLMDSELYSSSRIKLIDSNVYHQIEDKYKLKSIDYAIE